MAESESLLPVKAPSAILRTSALPNFLTMSFCFGISHAAVTVSIAYASSVFDLALGSYSIGAVYISYTLISLVLAAPIVDYIGAQKALVVALSSYLVYLVCYVISSFLDSSGDTTAEWTVVMIGALFGGFASGIGKAPMRDVWRAYKHLIVAFLRLGGAGRVFCSLRD